MIISNATSKYAFLCTEFTMIFYNNKPSYKAKNAASSVDGSTMILALYRRRVS